MVRRRGGCCSCIVWLAARITVLAASDLRGNRPAISSPLYYSASRMTLTKLFTFRIRISKSATYIWFLWFQPTFIKYNNNVKLSTFVIKYLLFGNILKLILLEVSSNSRKGFSTAHYKVSWVSKLEEIFEGLVNSITRNYFISLVNKYHISDNTFLPRFPWMRNTQYTVSTFTGLEHISKNKH